MEQDLQQLQPDWLMSWVIQGELLMHLQFAYRSSPPQSPQLHVNRVDMCVGASRIS